MQNLNLPSYSFKTHRLDEHKYEIFDPVRRQYVVLTPEEWVRQHLIRFLNEERGFPLSLMAIEKGLPAGDKDYRADIVCFDKQAQPILIVECKAPEVKLNQAVFNQAARYNQYYKVKHLLISNGLRHFCAEIDFDKSQSRILNHLPHFKELT